MKRLFVAFIIVALAASNGWAACQTGFSDLELNPKPATCNVMQSDGSTPSGTNSYVGNNLLPSTAPSAVPADWTTGDGWSADGNIVKVAGAVTATITPTASMGITINKYYYIYGNVSAIGSQVNPAVSVGGKILTDLFVRVGANSGVVKATSTENFKMVLGAERTITFTSLIVKEIQSDVASALAQVISGDTVLVPAGTWSWSSGVSVPTGAILKADGAVTIQSSSNLTNYLNTNSVIDGFIFENGVSIPNAGAQDWISYNNTYGNTVAFRDIDLGAKQSVNQGVYHHDTFNGYGWIINGKSKGVEEWALPTDFGGTDHVIYFEGCTFGSTFSGKTSLMDTSRGGMRVVRFNTINSMWNMNHGPRLSTTRSARKNEEYRNKWNNTAGIDPNPSYRSRGGSAMAFDNNTICSYPSSSSYCSYIIDGDSSAARVAAPCTVTSGYETVPHPGTGDSFLCRDIVSAGQDLTPPSAALPADQNDQTYTPGYFWRNQWNGSTGRFWANFYSGGGYPTGGGLEFRDWFVDATVQAGITGGGVKVGTLAQMAAVTCTASTRNSTNSAHYDGFWATDGGSDWNKSIAFSAPDPWSTPGEDGALYQCDGAGTWDLHYTPAPYPHPLVQTYLGETPTVYYLFTVSVVGQGTITTADGYINCPGTCTHSYESGSQPVVTATPAPGGPTFTSGWTAGTGLGTCINTTSPCTLDAMTAARTLEGTFNDPEPPDPALYLVTVVYGHPDGTANTGTGTSNPLPDAATLSFEEGAVVNISQTEGANSNFVEWQSTIVSAPNCNGSTGDCGFSMPAYAVTVYARWDDAPKYTLVVTPPTNGEEVSSALGYINCGATIPTNPCTHDYYGDETVVLTTVCPVTSNTIVYSGDCSGTTCSLDMTEDKTVGVYCRGGNTLGSGGRAYPGVGPEHTLF